MDIHEYQAKALLRMYGIPAPDGVVVHNVHDAVTAAQAMNLPVVLKAQVRAGGRGKAGGVKVVKELDEVEPLTDEILGLTIKGLPVRSVFVTPALNIQSEVYLSLLIDRAKRTAAFIGCAEGGVEIETTAKESPEKILRCEVSVAELTHLSKGKLMEFATRLFPDSAQAEATANIMIRMGRLFVEKDAALIEINPLIVDEHGAVIALDAKMTLDDNALFRNPDIAELTDSESTDEDELAAREAGLSFIRLDGAIGCMVNGAGLAMATMDIIKHYGGAPANFLDVGGSSDPEKVVAAFKLILKDPNVRVILINIFGGITRCDDIAKGILTSLEEFETRAPIVIRLVGTNEEAGRALLKDTDLITVRTLEEGAQKATALGGAS